MGSVLGLIVLFGIINGFWIGPIAKDNAQRDCVNMGYESFIDYTFLPFSTKPKALYCGTYEQRMIKEGRITAYQTGNNGTMIISDLGKSKE